LNLTITLYQRLEAGQNQLGAVGNEIIEAVLAV
jgi:hypothetical protein